MPDSCDKMTCTGAGKARARPGNSKPVNLGDRAYTQAQDAFLPFQRLGRDHPHRGENVFGIPPPLRSVEDLSHERGIDNCQRIVRFWWNRFRPILAADIWRKRVDRMHADTHRRWCLDEVLS